MSAKTTLAAAHITSARRRVRQFKELYPDRIGSPAKELRSPLFYGLLGHSHSWKKDASNPLGNVEGALNSSQEDVVHPRLDLDVICVADLATWSHTILAYHPAAWTPDPQANPEAALSTVGVMTSHICSALEKEGQAATFRPVGALLTTLINRLAWEDAAVRDLADYFRLANLWGSGSGSMRPWPLSVYSEEVRPQILAGKFTNGVPWDEWSVGFL